MKRHQVALLMAMLVAAGVLLSSSLSASAGVNNVDDAERVDQSVAPAANGTTVITTQGAALQGNTAEILAIDDSGDLLYHNDTYGVYFDVDAHPSGRWNVQYVASEPTGDGATMNHIEVVNLSTGDTRRLYSAETPNVDHSRWHDVDRINATHYVVAGIEHDRVFIVDVDSDTIVWEWYAAQSFAGPSETGGPPDDWTHLNDVEVLPDGRIMVSLRNHDQIVFLHRNGTLDEDWTLGADGWHDRLYEQHNPEYIPAADGGPAVVVSDSENDRVVEYQREDGGWVRTWTWQDQQLDWPRDADRLSNGHTLIVDSLGDRVLEVDRSGSVVWSVPVGVPYDAERIHTGDGPSALRADLDSRSVSTVYEVVPAKYRHGAMWVVPAWMSFGDILAGLVYICCGVTLLVDWRR